MKKRLLSILLIFCMMMSFVPMMANAIEIYIDLTIVGQANLTLEVEGADSIDNIKEKIRDKTGFSPDAQRLFLGEKELASAKDGTAWHRRTEKNCKHSECTDRVFRAKPRKQSWRMACDRL